MDIWSTTGPGLRNRKCKALISVGVFLVVSGNKEARVWDTIGDAVREARNGLREMWIL